MVWIKIKDIDLLRNFSLSTILDAVCKDKAFKDIERDFFDTIKKEDILLEPSDGALKKIFKDIFNGKEKTNKLIISFRDPNQTFWGYNHPFILLHATFTPFFPFKEQEVALNIPQERILNDLYGLSLIEPRYGFESIAGLSRIKEWVNQAIHLRDSLGIKNVIRSAFLFGTAGSGKTHVAEAIAHRLGYKFSFLDLPHFMTLPSPTKAIGDMFDFLENQDKKCLLLIDEIEKMFDFTGQDLKSKNVFGKLLTKLNDIYNDPNSNIIFIATANNIAPIVENNPEFLRKGRFSDIFFISYPKKEAVFAIMNMYVEVTKKKIINDISALFNEDSILLSKNSLLAYIKDTSNDKTFDDLIKYLTINLKVDFLYRMIDTMYTSEEKVSEGDEFIYSPPEIRAIIEDLSYRAMENALIKAEASISTNEEVDFKSNSAENIITDMEFIKKIVLEVVPLQISARRGIEQQVAQSRNYSGRGISTREQFKKGEH